MKSIIKYVYQYNKVHSYNFYQVLFHRNWKPTCSPHTDKNPITSLAWKPNIWVYFYCTKAWTTGKIQTYLNQLVSLNGSQFPTTFN